MNTLINNTVLLLIGSDKSKLSSLQLNKRLPDLYIPSITVMTDVNIINKVNTTKCIFIGASCSIIASAYEYIIPIKTRLKKTGSTIFVNLLFFLVLILNKFIPSVILALISEKNLFIPNISPFVPIQVNSIENHVSSYLFLFSF